MHGNEQNRNETSYLGMEEFYTLYALSLDVFVYVMTNLGNETLDSKSEH